MILAMNEAPKMKPLAAAETAVRRLLLMVGFGFIAYVAGSIFAANLMVRVSSRLDSGPGFLSLAVLDGAWVMIALPLIAHLAARFMELEPWRTAIVGAATGVVFQLALQYVSLGDEGITGDVPRLIGRVITLAAGIAITAWSVKLARAQAAVAEQRAREEAEKKKHQYDEFVKQAEAIAQRREEVPIAPAPKPPESS